MRRQLIAKESEVSRLNVQLKNLNRKLDRAQIEIELLRESRQKAGLALYNYPNRQSSSVISFIAGQNTTSATATLPNSKHSAHYSAPNLCKSLSKSTSNKKDIKLCRQVYSLEEIINDPLKLRLYLDKLNIQLKEKDVLINKLNETLDNQQKAEQVLLNTIQEE